jgi:5-methylcytosine-specific restriction endonuclease McrA
LEGQEIEIHHKQPKAIGGNESETNLMALHRECHHQVTYSKDLTLKAQFVKQGIIKDA